MAQGPPTIELIRMTTQNREQQIIFFENIRVWDMNKVNLDQLKAKSSLIPHSDFRISLQQLIRLRFIALDGPQQQNIKRETLTLERQKFAFSKIDKDRNFRLQESNSFLSIIFVLVAASGVLFGYYQAPQFAVPKGGQVKSGTTNLAVEILVGIVLVSLGLVGLITSIIYCITKYRLMPGNRYQPVQV